MNSPMFRELVGLPGDGPLPKSFSPNGRELYSEGYVIEFYPGLPNSWVGNFAGGGSIFSAVVQHPNRIDVFVVARGQGYLLEPGSKELISFSSPDITFVLPLPGFKQLLASTNTRLELVEEDGSIWKSPRISLDGIYNLHLSGDLIEGEAWCGDDVLVHFGFHLKSRTVEGRFPN